MSGRMIREPGGPGPAEREIFVRTFRREFGAVLDLARAYRMTDGEIRALVEEVFDLWEVRGADEPALCAWEPLWKAQAYPGADACQEPASPGSDFCPRHDPDLL